MGDSNTPTIYRYKLSIEVMDEITTFSKVHQYDDRHTYKEAWNRWKDDHDDFISAEAERLRRLGYVGSVEDKMYKAGRYYFRKKKHNKAESETKPSPSRAYGHGRSRSHGHTHSQNDERERVHASNWLLRFLRRTSATARRGNSKDL